MEGTNEIVERVETKMGVAFEQKEVESVLLLTERKMELNGKGKDYFPLLFQNELEDLVLRKAINALYQ